MFASMTLDFANTSTVYEQQAVGQGRWVIDCLGRAFSRDQLLPEAGMRKRLAELATLPVNWDGEGAEPLSNLTLTNARNIALLLSGKTRFPEITPNAGDTITFEWESSAGSALMEIGHATYSFWMKTRNGEQAMDAGKLASEADIAALGTKIERKLFSGFTA